MLSSHACYQSWLKRYEIRIKDLKGTMELPKECICSMHVRWVKLWMSRWRNYLFPLCCVSWSSFSFSFWACVQFWWREKLWLIEKDLSQLWYNLFGVQHLWQSLHLLILINLIRGSCFLPSTVRNDVWNLLFSLIWASISLAIAALVKANGRMFCNRPRLHQSRRWFMS